MKRNASDRSRTWRRMMDIHSAQERARKQAIADRVAASRASAENLSSSPLRNPSESKEKGV